MQLVQKGGMKERRACLCVRMRACASVKAHLLSCVHMCAHVSGCVC